MISVSRRNKTIKEAPRTRKKEEYLSRQTYR